MNIVFKGNTYLITKIAGFPAWTIRNVNNNTFIGEVELSLDDMLTVRCIPTRATRTLSSKVVKNESEMAHWAVKFIHTEIYS